MGAGRDDRPHPVRAGEAVSARGADPRRRPLPARARQRRADREDRGRPRPRGRARHAARARQRPAADRRDPRPSSASRRRRPARCGGCAVLHRRGSFLLPARGLPRPRRRRLPRRAAARRRRLHPRPAARRPAARACAGARGVVYEAHAVESIMYRERGALYGTAETAAARPRRPACAGARRGSGGGRAAFVATTAGIRDTFTEQLRRARAACAWSPTGATCPPTGRSPASPPSAPPRVLYAGQLYPVEGRRRAGGGDGAGARARAS